MAAPNPTTLHFNLGDLERSHADAVVEFAGWYSGAMQYELADVGQRVWRIDITDGQVNPDTNVPDAVDGDILVPITFHRFRATFERHLTKAIGMSINDYTVTTGIDSVYINVARYEVDPDYAPSELSMGDDSESIDSESIDSADNESIGSEDDESIDSDDEIEAVAINHQRNAASASPSPAPRHRRVVESDDEDEPETHPHDHYQKLLDERRSRGEQFLMGWDYYENPKTGNSYILTPADATDALNWNVPLRLDIGTSYPIFYRENFGGWIVSKKFKTDLDKAGARELV